MSFKTELLSRADEYAESYGLTLGDELGFGVHGIVLLTRDKFGGAQSALKVHQQEPAFQRERDIYLRLKERGIESIRGCNVPQLLRYDDLRWAIEMTVVTRPYVLDFAGTYLDTRPDFSEEVMADWHEMKQDQFGERWPEVLTILAVLETYGIFMEDVSPSNVALIPLKAKE